MTKIKFLKSVGIALCTMLFFSSCKVLFFSSNRKDQNTVTMTTAKEGEVILYVAGSGKMTIDWGDRTPRKTYKITAMENGTLTDFHRYSHTYSKASTRTIIISGENIMLLGCWDNQLVELDVSKNNVLTRLACDNNQLTKLDVSKNSVLTGLGCNNNQLTELDVSQNNALIILNCGNNPLTKLDVSKNHVLTGLYCYNNQLEELNVSGAVALRRVECWNNLFDAPALNTLFGTLYGNKASSIVIGGNPGEIDCDQNIAESKGWTVITSIPIIL